jgi:hypothetical protein
MRIAAKIALVLCVVVLTVHSCLFALPKLGLGSWIGSIASGLGSVFGLAALDIFNRILPKSPAGQIK